MSSKDLSVVDRATIPAELQEKVLIGGDLAKLTPSERLSYYSALCTSLGLNPLTQPFEYITLNGKLRLYAKKDCTDQLRKVHGVSIVPGSTRVTQIEDVRVVTVAAQDVTGRTDEGTGAVSVGGLKGDALANAIMKCETKAKRRVTLSLCGLGMLDETEIETIPEARVQPPQVRPQVGNRTFGGETKEGSIEDARGIPDEYYPKPNKPAADGPVSEAVTLPTEGTQQGGNTPQAPSSGAALAKHIADTMDQQFEDGFIGSLALYQGTKSYQKGVKPGYFDLEDGTGKLVRKFKYMDPELDVSSGLKRVYYRTEVYQGKTSFAATKIDPLE